MYWHNHYELMGHFRTLYIVIVAGIVLNDVESVNLVGIVGCFYQRSWLHSVLCWMITLFLRKRYLLGGFEEIYSVSSFRSRKIIKYWCQIRSSKIMINYMWNKVCSGESFSICARDYYKIDYNLAWSGTIK